MNDDDDDRQSEDDALEPADDIYNPDIDEEKLAGDNDSPAAPADDNGQSVPPDDPRTDTDIDEDELYSEGLDQAVGANDSKIDSDDSPPEPVELEPQE